MFGKLKYNNKGTALIFVLVFGAVASMIIISGVAGYAIFENKASNRKQERDLAFHIAEAGINYYRWHLAHNPTDYSDGTGGQPGPYIHEYDDKDGNLMGYFSLEIDEPLTGTTVVVVRSTGWTIGQPDSTRTIQARLGFPALTDYAFVEHANMRFSNTTEVHGKVHSNGYIEFNGVTDSLVQSAKQNGVYGAGGPVGFWDYPVPEKDFYGITADLAVIRDMSDEPGGIHLNSSGAQGWHIVFNPNETFDLFRVNTVRCYYGQGFKWWWWWYGDTHCYDINTESFVQNYAMPANGAIFSEDHVWTEGTVNGRVTIGAGRFPVQQSTYRRIQIVGNILYNEKSSDDVLGLIAQGDIIVPRDVPNEMEIDAAALSQF